jgi:hypothetical protein
MPLLAIDLMELVLEQSSVATLVLLEEVLMFDLIFEPSLVISLADLTKNWLLALLRDGVIDLVSGPTLMA